MVVFSSSPLASPTLIIWPGILRGEPFQSISSSYFPGCTLLPISNRDSFTTDWPSQFCLREQPDPYSFQRPFNCPLPVLYKLPKSAQYTLSSRVYITVSGRRNPAYWRCKHIWRQRGLTHIETTFQLDNIPNSVRFVLSVQGDSNVHKQVAHFLSTLEDKLYLSSDEAGQLAELTLDTVVLTVSSTDVDQFIGEVFQDPAFEVAKVQNVHKLALDPHIADTIGTCTSSGPAFTLPAGIFVEQQIEKHPLVQSQAEH